MDIAEAANKYIKNFTLIVMKEPAIIKNSAEIFKILNRYHNDPLSGGHCGLKRTMAKIKANYYWKNIKKTIKSYIKSCEKCKINKPKKNTKENLVITETPLKAFDVVQIDTVGPINPTVDGFKYIVSAQCELTKFIILAPTKSKEANEIAKIIFNKVILRFGPMTILKSDKGTEYCNEIVKSLCDLLKVEHRQSTPYHSQTIGMLERNHRELNVFLRNYVDLPLHDWDKWLAVYAYAYNTTPNSYHSYTPFQLVHGFNPKVIEEFLTGTVSPVYNIDDYSKVVRYQLEIAHKRAREMVETEKLRRKVRFDKENNNPLIVKPGDLIYLKIGNRSKFDPFYEGPFKVIEDCGNNNIKILDDKNKEKIVHKNNTIIA